MRGVLSVTQRKLGLATAEVSLALQSPRRRPWSSPYLGSAALCFLMVRRLNRDVFWIMDLLLSL